MKEELLKRMSEGQCYLEQSLIEEMKQQYHHKIEALQQEIRNLEKEKQTEQNVDKKAPNKQKLQELEIQIREFKKKEKLQTGLAKQVSLQKNQLDSLAEEIKAIKRQKIQLMKKLKEDTENFEKWKTSQMKKLNDLTRKNQEKDEQIQRLKKERNEKIEAKKSMQMSATKTEKSKSFCQRRSLRRRSSFLEESGLNVKNALVVNGVEIVKENTMYKREVNSFLKEILSLEDEQAEMIRKVSDLKLEIERLSLEKASNNTIDYEDQINYQNKEEELTAQRREIYQVLESVEEKLKFRKRKLEEVKKKTPKKIKDFIQDLFKKGPPGIQNEQFKEVVDGFYERFSEVFGKSLENSEKAEQAGVELTEIKKNYEALDQKFKVSQAQYELNLTKITTEYEERCLFLIKQQNEQMMSTGESSVDVKTMKRDSENFEEKKKNGGVSVSVKKNYEELLEKNLKLEKNVAGTLKLTLFLLNIDFIIFYDFQFLSIFINNFIYHY